MKVADWPAMHFVGSVLSLGDQKEEEGSLRILQCFALRSVRQVVCGGAHSLALLTSGELWEWKASAPPTRISFDEEVLYCSAGNTHSAAIARRQGKPALYFWGFMQEDDSNPTEALSTPTYLEGLQQSTPIKLCSGQNHLLVVARGTKLSKHLLIYTRPRSGMLGRQLSAGAVQANIARLFHLACENVVEAWACDRHCFYQYEKKRKSGVETGLVAWGDNSCGQLGLGHFRLVNKFEDVSFFNDTKVLDIAGGPSHTVVLTGRRIVFTFGSNSEGQLGVPGVPRSSNPLPIELPEGACRLSAGNSLNYAISLTGLLYSWGSAKHLPCPVPQPELVSPSLFNNDPVLAVAVGLNHSLFLTADLEANTPRISKRSLDRSGPCPKRRKN
jgi:hypothetical protein